MGFYEVWASLSSWQRRGALVGLAGFLGSAMILVDVSMLRPREYEAEWKEREDQERARNLLNMLQPSQHDADSGLNARQQPLTISSSQATPALQEEVAVATSVAAVSGRETGQQGTSHTVGQQEQTHRWFWWPRARSEQI